MTQTGDETPRASPDVLAAHLEGEAVLLHLGTKQYYRLNETGAVIWKGLEQGLDASAIVAELTREFEVDPKIAESEFRRTLEELRERGLLAP
jgi:PqqD family protein of HPr-rel-A system